MLSFLLMAIAVPILVMLAILILPQWPLEGNNKNLQKFILSSIVSWIICGLISVIAWQTGTSHMRFKEVWNMKITSIRHEMQWTTEETETYEEKVGEDAEGNTIYETRIRYYTEKHGPYWYKITEYDTYIPIPETEYENWKNIWKNSKQTSVNKGSAAFGDRSIDGPIFECNWPGTFESIFPFSEIHIYVNKVRASDGTIMKYGEPSKELLNKYPRPSDQNNMEPVINYCSYNIDSISIKRANAELGPSYEIHALFILFDVSETGLDIVNDIMRAWQGPNKNELVTFIGLDNGVAKWVKVESWMDNTTIHGMMADCLMNKKITGEFLSKNLLNLVPKYWKRKHFSDWDYLEITIKPVIRWLCFFTQIVATLLSCIWIHHFVESRVKRRDIFRFYGRRIHWR